MAASRKYVKIVEWSEEDQTYVGSAPGLIFGGCHVTTSAPFSMSFASSSMKQSRSIAPITNHFHHQRPAAISPTSCKQRSSFLSVNSAQNRHPGEGRDPRQANHQTTNNPLSLPHQTPAASHLIGQDDGGTGILRAAPSRHLKRVVDADLRRHDGVGVAHNHNKVRHPRPCEGTADAQPPPRHPRPSERASVRRWPGIQRKNSSIALDG